MIPLRRTDLEPCVVFGPKFPVWLHLLEALGFSPHTIVVEDPLLQDWLMDVFDPPGGVLTSLSAVECPQGLACFCDGRVNNAVARTCERLAARVVLSTKGLRLQYGAKEEESGWCTHRMKVNHASVGGVTNVDVTACAHWKGSHRPTFGVVADLVPRDASLIVSSTERCSTKETGPREPVDPLAVVNVGTEERPVYRSDGLLPDVRQDAVYVLAPSCFTPGFWGRRALTQKEACEALDVPNRFLGPLTLLLAEDSLSLADLCPLGPLLEMGRHLLAPFERGGGFFFAHCDGGSRFGR